MSTQPTEYEFAVQQLVELGFPREHAETQVRTQLRHLAPPAPAFNEAKDRGLERDEQIEIRKLAIAYGFKVDNLSQYRPSKIAVGFPDLFLRHRAKPLALFWETKRAVGGHRSTAQVEFGADVTRCGVGYGFGDRRAFVAKLIEIGCAVRGEGAYGIEPARST